MKKLLFTAALICLLNISSTYAQTGKPQYLIETKRADTTYGYITIELFPLIAPLHSAYFDSLVNINFYDSTAFHRVVPDFVIQGGDPNSKHGERATWGNGDPSQKNIPAEFSKVAQVRGTIGAARDTDINSANSQFYINMADNSFLTAGYTCYGQVVEGMAVADSIVAVPRDENDNPLEKIEMFVTKLGINNDKPAATSLVAPLNGTNGVLTNLQLEWQAVEGVLLYEIEFATDPEFANITLTDNTGSTYIFESDFEPGLVIYYWRVRTNNGGYRSEYSEVRNFITSIAAPTLEFPLNTSDSTSTEIEFIWHPVKGAVSYTFQIATRPTFSTSSMIYNVSGLTDTFNVVSELEGGVKHYWRVWGNSGTYEGPKSEVWNFTPLQTTEVASSREMPNSYSLAQNYPNPFNPSTTIAYSIPEIDVLGQVEGQNVTLIIYDMLGNKITTLVNESKPAGNYKVLFNASSGNLRIVSGIYLYKLQSGAFSETKKMLLIR